MCDRFRAESVQRYAKREKPIFEDNKRLSREAKEHSDAMDKLQKDYQAKALDLKRFQDDAQRELEETQRKELSELEKRIMPVIDTVAKEQGFQLVFNKFQSGLLYADTGIDLTEAVITRFNTQITAAPSKAPAKAVTAAPATKAPAPAAAPATKTPAPAPKKP